MTRRQVIGAAGLLALGGGRGSGAVGNAPAPPPPGAEEVAMEAALAAVLADWDMVLLLSERRSVRLPSSAARGLAGSRIDLLAAGLGCDWRCSGRAVCLAPPLVADSNLPGVRPAPAQVRRGTAVPVAAAGWFDALDRAACRDLLDGQALDLTHLPAPAEAATARLWSALSGAAELAPRPPGTARLRPVAGWEAGALWGGVLPSSVARQPVASEASPVTPSATVGGPTTLGAWLTAGIPPAGLEVTLDRRFGRRPLWVGGGGVAVSAVLDLVAWGCGGLLRRLGTAWHVGLDPRYHPPPVSGPLPPVVLTSERCPVSGHAARMLGPASALAWLDFTAPGSVITVLLVFAEPGYLPGEALSCGLGALLALATATGRRTTVETRLRLVRGWPDEMLSLADLVAAGELLGMSLQGYAASADEALAAAPCIAQFGGAHFSLLSGTTGAQVHLLDYETQRTELTDEEFRMAYSGFILGSTKPAVAGAAGAH